MQAREAKWPNFYFTGDAPRPFTDSGRWKEYTLQDSDDAGLIYFHPVGCSCRVIPVPCKTEIFCTHEDVAVGRICKPERLGPILIHPLGRIVPC